MLLKLKLLKFFITEQVAVKNINLAIENTDAEQLMKALQNPAAQLSPIDDTAPMLYCDEFCSIRQEKQASLEYHEIFNAVKSKFVLLFY